MELASDCHITVMVENKNDLDEFNSIQRFFQTTSFKNIKLLFNSFNFLASGLMPLHEVFFSANFKKKIGGILLIDGINLVGESKKETVKTEIGQGNAQIIELISANKARSFDGMLIYPVSLSEDNGNKQVISSKINTIRTLLGKL